MYIRKEISRSNLTSGLQRGTIKSCEIYSYITWIVNFLLGEALFQTGGLSHFLKYLSIIVLWLRLTKANAATQIMDFID